MLSLRRFVLIVGLLLVVLTCVCLALLPRRAAAEGETPVIVVNFPTPIPYPTQQLVPMSCSTPTVATPDPVCGVSAVTVGHRNGEGGVLLALLIVNIFGFSFVGVVAFIYAFVRR